VRGPHFERVVIDGVPAYIGDQQGHVAAGISFRVGTADEEALDRGLTALIAELAAIDVENVEFDVGAARTSFVARGRADAVSAALGAVCAAIGAFDDADLGQLADTILDEPQPVPPLQTTLLGLRFGAQAYGTIAIPPLALLRVDGAIARAWAARFFTRGNAALWSTGPLASTVELPLPPGDRTATPAPTEPECALPAWCPNAWVDSTFRDAVDCSIVASGVDATTVALRAFATEVVERLHETRLRGREPEITIDAWSDELAHVSVSLDTLAHGNDGIECILGSLDDFADLGPDPDELADAITEIQMTSTEPANVAAVAEMLANDELRTGRARNLDEFLAAIEAVTAEQVAAAFDVMRGDIIVTTPSTAEIVDPRFTLLETATGLALDGTQYRRATVSGAPDDDARLTVGPDGVTYVSADELLTVCYEDCVAAVTYPDHSITLFDIDGTTIEIAEADWRDGERAFAAIEAAVPTEVALAARRGFGRPIAALANEVDEYDEPA
jgi:zinc protease